MGRYRRHSDLLGLTSLNKWRGAWTREQRSQWTQTGASRTTHENGLSAARRDFWETRLNDARGQVTMQ